MSEPPQIAIVDDDGGQRQLLENALTRAGFRTTLCKNGEEGLAVANVKVYLVPREFKFYHGSPISRTLFGSVAGGSVGAATGSATATALGQNSATLEALGGTSGAMALGAGAGALGGAALMEE